VVVPQRVQQADPWIKQEIKVARYTTGQYNVLRKTKMMVSHRNLLKESEMNQARAKRLTRSELNDKKPVG